MKALFDIDKIVDDRFNILIKGLIDKLIVIGERCVATARNKGNYQDQTGNLRGSVGYVVLYNGAVQGKSVGRGTSQKLIEELTPEYNRGLVLLVVAGEKYALYVEAKNYDVLTSAELQAEKIVPQMLKELGLEI